MTALLPPNLLKLFAPRPPVPYLKPLVKDDAKRGPNKLSGVGRLVTRIRTEADEEEIQQGLKDDANVTNGKQPEGTKMEPEGQEAEIKTANANAIEVDGNEDGQVKETVKVQPKTTVGGGNKKKDPIRDAGVVGQEAVKMRREARRKRQEEYKKHADETCEYLHPMVGTCIMSNVVTL